VNDPAACALRGLEGLGIRSTLDSAFPTPMLGAVLAAGYGESWNELERKPAASSRLEPASPANP